MFLNDIFSIVYDMKIAILALDDVFDTGLSVLMDTLATANELSEFGIPPFDIRLIGVCGQIRTARGLTAAVEIPDLGYRPDWVVLPALNIKQPERLLQALNRPDVMSAKKRLRGWHTSGVNIAAACLGTFILADAGLLDGCEATTTWSMAPLFRQRYPNVSLDDSRMVVSSDRIATAGAAMGHLDLALWLVRLVSPELASQVARFLLIDTRSSQGQYIIPDHLAHSDPLIERFERWARAGLAAGFSLQGAAAALHVHPRTLQRRTEAILGKSPLSFFQDLRVEQARRLVAAGHPLEVIAELVGYSDAATLRNLLRRKLGRGVRELRSELS